MTARAGVMHLEDTILLLYLIIRVSAVLYKKIVAVTSVRRLIKALNQKVQTCTTVSVEFSFTYIQRIPYFDRHSSSFFHLYTQ